MTGESWVRIDCGRQRWWVDPAWGERLLGGEGLRLAEWERGGQVEVIKQSITRTVYRVSLAGQTVFVKHYPIGDWRSRVRRWLRPAKALHEWRQTLQLRRGAVPTVTPLAVGVRPDGASYFVTEAIEGAVGLYSYVRAHGSSWSLRERRAVLAEAGRFVADLYCGGIVHRDLHAENVLVRWEAPGPREWFVIDPYEVNKAAPRQRDLRTSLTLLGMAFWPDLSPTDRARFWRAFRRAAGDSVHLARFEELQLLREVDADVWRRTCMVWSKRAGRCLGVNRDFARLRDDGCTMWASRSLPEAWLRNLVRHPLEVLQSPGARVLKASRHGQVAVVPGPGGKPLVYKRFDRAGWGGWRESPARRSYRMAYRLELGRVPTARPLAVAESRNGTSYLLTEYLQDAVSLIEFMERCRADGDRRTLRSFVWRLAKSIRRMHALRMSHRDLKAVNLLVREAGPVFVDLRGMSSHWWLSRGRRQKDLARLAVSAMTTLRASRSDLLRFLLTYLGQESGQWRAWWCAVALLCRKKVARNERRDRVVS